MLFSGACSYDMQFRSGQSSNCDICTYYIMIIIYSLFKLMHKVFNIICVKIRSNILWCDVCSLNYEFICGARKHVWIKHDLHNLCDWLILQYSFNLFQVANHNKYLLRSKQKGDLRYPILSMHMNIFTFDHETISNIVQCTFVRLCRLCYPMHINIIAAIFTHIPCLYRTLYTSSKESCHLIGSTVSRGF